MSDKQTQDDDLLPRMCEACDRNAMPTTMMKNLIAEAIGEIEMLRYDVKALEDELEGCRIERDSARRELCECIAVPEPDNPFRPKPWQVARSRWWGYLCKTWRKPNAE